MTPTPRPAQSAPETGARPATRAPRAARSAPESLDIDLRIARRDFDVTARLTIGPGERMALFGPSGAGKTTLLESIAGLVHPTSGAVRIGELTLTPPPATTGTPTAKRDSGSSRQGHEARTTRRRGARGRPSRVAAQTVSIVRQPTMLFPHLDVTGNIAYGDADERLVAVLMEQMGLAELRRARPSELSGGQAQRVALARALARRFAVLLLDEPMAAIDRPGRAELWAVVGDRLVEEAASALLVTHDLREAQAFGGTLALVDRGRILSCGTPHDVVAAPVSRRAAELVGFSGWLDLGGDQVIVLDPARVLLGRHADEGATFAGKVVRCTPAGTGFEAAVEVPEGTAMSLRNEGIRRVASPSTLVVNLDQHVLRGATIDVTARRVAWVDRESGN